MAIVKLNLPTLPDSTKTKVRLMSNKFAHDNNRRLWLNEFHNNQVNSVNHDYVLSPELDDEVRKVYGEYFNEPFVTMIGVQRNVTDQLACTPVHCDRGRRTAINFFIESGGDNVKTSVYDHIRDDSDDLNEALNLQYNLVTKLNSYHLKNDTWYAFSVQQGHSVENIETLRIFLGIVLKSNPKFEQFLKEHDKILT